MAFVAAASQLAAATAGSGGLGAAAQATASVSSVASVLAAGTDRARGAIRSLAGEAQVRAGLLGLGGDRASVAAIPSDGTRCEGCGEQFGALRRRSSCTACNRFLCASCFGRSPLAGMVGISCFCGSVCPRCRDQNAQTGEFESCRRVMESGAGVTLGLPKKAAASTGLFFGGGASGAPGAQRRIGAWLSLDAERGELHWATLEQRQGRPVEEGGISVCEVLAVRNTGVALEVPVKGYTQPFTLEFGTPEERESWARYIELAVQVLTPESERAALDAARASHREREVEDRRLRNEERKKKLSENLGMRFTAEAMMSRDQGHR